MTRPRRARLDEVLTESGLVASRQRAQALIMAGLVKVDGATVRQPAQHIRVGSPVELASPPAYVSRGGEKLAPALDVFGIKVAGRICADIGASTGGFTDVLLSRGAARVYAVDVGRGLLHWKLRQEGRVVVLEGVNARFLQPFPEPVDLVTVDVSFIGLDAVLPAVARATGLRCELIVLFKPQFEVERGQVEPGGVVRDPEAVRAALERFRAWAGSQGFGLLGEAPAALRGPAGNQEHFLHLKVGEEVR